MDEQHSKANFKSVSALDKVPKMNKALYSPFCRARKTNEIKSLLLIYITRQDLELS